MLDSGESARRVNGGMHYTDAVYRKHAPTTNYVKYIIKLMNNHLFAGENRLACLPSQDKIKITLDNHFLFLLNTAWIENFRRIRASALERFIVQQLKRKGINFKKNTPYYNCWILAENKQLIKR
jgi:hypothetical protein